MHPSISAQSVENTPLQPWQWYSERHMFKPPNLKAVIVGVLYTLNDFLEISVSRHSRTKHCDLHSNLYVNVYYWYQVNCHFIRVRKSVCAGFLLCTFDWVCNVQRFTLWASIWAMCLSVLVYFCVCLFSSGFGSPEHKSCRSTRWHKFIKLPRLRAII